MEAEIQMSDAVSVEDRLLGGLIDGMTSHPGTVVPLLGILEPEHFGRESNRAVFVAVATLYHLGRAVDLANIYQYLCETGHAHRVAGAVDLAELWEVRCRLDEVGEFVALLTRGIGRSAATTPRPLPPADAPQDNRSSLGEGETSFEFGANAPESESGDTGA